MDWRQKSESNSKSDQLIQERKKEACLESMSPGCHFIRNRRWPNWGALIRTNLRVGRQSFWTLCQPRVRGYRLAGSSVSIQNLNRDRRQLEVGGHKGPSELEVSPTFNSHLPVAPSCVANVLFQNRMSASPIGVRTARLLFWSSRPNFGLAATKVVQSLYSTSSAQGPFFN